MKINLANAADDVRVTCPLFQAEYGGANPTSALHLRFSKTDIKRALKMNRQWHSRMPKLTNWQGCLAYSAANVVYAVAIWGRPVAREFNGRGYIELRRMAIQATKRQRAAVVEMSGNETDEQCKDIAWQMFCNAHPVEAYRHNPDGFWKYFHARAPDMTREQMAALLKECEEPESESPNE